MAVFQWTAKSTACALMLAEGYTKAEVAAATGVGERTIYRWQTALEFQEEVDRLTVMLGIASRAGRLRVAHRAIRQKQHDGMVITDKDVLDWLKFAQSETDGVKSDLASSLIDLAASVAGRSGGAGEQTGG